MCYFEDNRQCEEWALLRGDCPVGGVKVTGYATPAARYCAITGGTYTVTGKSGAVDEQGTCTSRTARSAMPGTTITASAKLALRRLLRHSDSRRRSDHSAVAGGGL